MINYSKLISCLQNENNGVCVLVIPQGETLSPERKCGGAGVNVCINEDEIVELGLWGAYCSQVLCKVF